MHWVVLVVATLRGRNRDKIEKKEIRSIFLGHTKSEEKATIEKEQEEHLIKEGPTGDWRRERLQLEHKELESRT